MTGAYVTWTKSRWWMHGSLVTWDGEAKAGYLTVCPDPDKVPGAMCSHRVDRTVELGNGVNIDVDADGCVYGIETLGHEVKMEDLILALRWYQQQAQER